MKKNKKINKIDKEMINVLGVTENEDGTADVMVEYNDDFVEFYKTTKKKKKATKKGLSNFMLELISKHLYEK